MGATTGHRLEQDHHRIDAGFARFAESLTGPALDRAAYDDAARALRHHIYVEETLHFPLLRAAGLLAPVLVLLREHGEIWDLLEAGTAALDERDHDAARMLWPRLATVLEQHNAKEERILYPAGDQRLSPADADRILDALATAETPPGWTCEMAGHQTSGAGP